MPANPLRLLQVVHTTGHGGLERQVLSLSRGLRAAGHEVTIATPANAWLAQRARSEGFSCVPIPFRSLTDLSSYLALAQLVRRERFDVVHGHSRRSALYSAIGARLGRSQSVSTVHSLNTWKSFRLNRRIIAVSEAVREFLLAKGLPQDRIVRIYNGVQSPQPVSEHERATLRRSLDLPEGCIAIGMVGRMVQSKGHDLLLQAAARMRQSHGFFQLLLIGEPTGPWAERLRSMIVELGLQQHVRMLGYHENVDPLLPALDMLIQPSRTEALSLSLLEALAAGVPVVAARTGGMPEIVVHGHNGLLFEPGDSGDLACQILRLCDGHERERISASTRASLNPNFTAKAMVDSTEWLYRQVSGRLARR